MYYGKHEFIRFRILDDDVLNIIGDYVQKDNERRIDKEDDFEKNQIL